MSLSMVPEKLSKIANGEALQENNTCLKQTELGEIPEEWRIVTLQDVCDWIGVGIASAATHAYTDVGVPMLRNQNIKEGYIDSSDLLYITPDFDEKNKTKRIRQGDVITIRTGYPGLSAVVPPKFDQCQCFTTLISRPLFDILSPEFLCCWINSDKGKSFVLSGQAGGAQQNFNVGVLRKMPLPLPPLPEQKRIAEILSSVDEAIASTQAAIDQTRKVKQGLLQQLLTRGIGHTKFKESAIGEIPECWKLTTIKELVLDEKNSITAGPFGTIFKAKDFRESGVPIVQIRHVTEDGFSWRSKVTYMDEGVYEQLHKPYTVRSGDLLITKMGEPPGIACIYPDGEAFGMVTPDVIKATLDPQKVNTYFLMCLYNSPQMKNRILDLTKGGTRARVTLDEFYKLLLPLPSLDEQIKISNVLFALDEVICTEKKKLDNCEEIKRGLMQDLLTGKVRVGCTS